MNNPNITKKDPKQCYFARASANDTEKRRAGKSYVTFSLNSKCSGCDGYDTSCPEYTSPQSVQEQEAAETRERESRMLEGIEDTQEFKKQRPRNLRDQINKLTGINPKVLILFLPAFGALC